jgi:hypothetical protein
LQVEVTPYVGHDLFAADDGASEVGVAAGLEGDGVACGYMGVGVGQVVAVGVALALAGTGGDAES